MDFQKVIQALVGEFEKNGVQYAVIGGFSLGLHGIPRATIDLDFLINKEDLNKIDPILSELGYKLSFRSENVSQYTSDLKIFGEVDFLHAFRERSLRMLQRAVEVPVFQGAARIKVLLPEDIIGLKVQAVANNQNRSSRDYPDIEGLMQHFGAKLDWDILADYFTLFGLQKEYDEYRRKYGTSQ
jgi:hypothetical protein